MSARTRYSTRYTRDIDTLQAGMTELRKLTGHRWSLLGKPVSEHAGRTIYRWAIGCYNETIEEWEDMGGGYKNPDDHLFTLRVLLDNRRKTEDRRWDAHQDLAHRTGW